MSSLFNIPKISEAYDKHRYSAPPQVVDLIISYLSEKVSGPFKNALDVGCGTGPSTRILSPYFESVTGTDVSERQLSVARRHPETPKNVQYWQAPAESVPFEKSSLQLITASSSFHWFDKEKFLQAASTMLQEDGVIAIYLLDPPYICGKTQQQTDKIKSIIKNNQMKTFPKFWDARVADLYHSLWSTGRTYAELTPHGFKDERREMISTEMEGVPLDSIVGWQTTMPEYYQLVESEGENAGLNYFLQLKKDILEELGMNYEVSGQTQFQVGFSGDLIVARK